MTQRTTSVFEGLEEKSFYQSDSYMRPDYYLPYSLFQIPKDQEESVGHDLLYGSAMSAIIDVVNMYVGRCVRWQLAKNCPTPAIT